MNGVSQMATIHLRTYVLTIMETTTSFGYTPMNAMEVKITVSMA